MFDNDCTNCAYFEKRSDVDGNEDYCTFIEDGIGDYEACPCFRSINDEYDE